VKEFRNRYFAKYSGGNGFSTPGYRHIMLIADALKRANTLTDMEKSAMPWPVPTLVQCSSGIVAVISNSVNQIVPSLGVFSTRRKAIVFTRKQGN